jgi:hypothetical protein
MLRNLCRSYGHYFRVVPSRRNPGKYEFRYGTHRWGPLPYRDMTRDEVVHFLTWFIALFSTKRKDHHPVTSEQLHHYFRAWRRKPR